MTYLGTCMLSHFSHVQFFVTLCTVAHWTPLSLGFSRQKYCSGLPFPPPGDIPNSGIEPVSLLAGEFFTTSATHFLAHSYSRHTSIHGLPTRGPRHTRGQGSAFPSRKPAVACRSASPTRGQTPDARKRILQSVDPTCTEQARPYSGTSWSPALPTSSPHKLWDNLDPVCNGVRNWSPSNLQPDTSSWIPESCSQTPAFGSACQ